MARCETAILVTLREEFESDVGAVGHARLRSATRALLSTCGLVDNAPALSCVLKGALAVFDDSG